jgi:four helix bundle protein
MIVAFICQEEPSASMAWLSHQLDQAVATFKCFEEIEAWQKARVLTRELYGATGSGPFSKDFGLRDQVRRAAVSVMSNIAEGFERDGTNEFLHFLSIAKGSLAEIQSHLYVAFDQGYVTKDQFDCLRSLTSENTRLIAGLMNYLRRSGLKGIKYRKAGTGVQEEQMPFYGNNRPQPGG